MSVRDDESSLKSESDVIERTSSYQKKLQTLEAEDDEQGISQKTLEVYQKALGLNR